MDSQKSQIHIFKSIESKLSSSQKMVDVIADILGVKKNAIYQRMSGEVKLSAVELREICTKLNLSMDELLYLGSKTNVMCQYRPIFDKESYINYMKELSDGLLTVCQASDKEFIFTARQIPFVHFMNYPELALLKVYAWYKARNKGDKSFSEFCSVANNRELVSLHQQIHKCYTQIPSTEIWMRQTVDATLKILEDHYESGTFDDEDKQLLLIMAGQLLELIKTVRTYAVDGYKEGNDKIPFLLHICSEDVENESIMIRVGAQWCSIDQRHSINRISTLNLHFCNDDLKWTDYLKSKSIHISGNTATKEKNLFFNQAKDMVQAFVNKIEA